MPGAEPAAAPGAGDEDLASHEPGELAKRRLREVRRRSRRSPLRWLLDVRSGERALRAAVQGQEEVGRQLRKLGPGWQVLHSVPLGDHVIDHLVIGPPGVFALVVRNHLKDRVKVKRSVVKVNGRTTSYLRDVRPPAHDASERLSGACGFDVEVRPVLVVLAAHLAEQQQPEVPVVGRKRIARWLMEQPGQQPFETTSAVHAAARHPGTWA